MRYTNLAVAGLLGLASTAVAGTVLSGSGNTAPNNNLPPGVQDSLSVVAGGANNAARGVASGIVGGVGNVAAGDASIIGGGVRNVNNGVLSVIGGGYENRADSSFSGIVGGYQNTVSGGVGFIGGGVGNNASGAYSAIVNGFGNTASGSVSTVVNGVFNSASGDYSTVLGGFGSSAQGVLSLVFGNQATAAARGAILFASSQDPTTANVVNSFNVVADGGIFLESDGGLFFNGESLPTIITNITSNSTTTSGSVPSESFVQVTPSAAGVLNLPTSSRAFDLQAGSTTFSEVSLIQGNFPAGAIITLVNNTTGTAVAFYDEETSGTNIDLNTPVESLVGRTGVLQLIALPDGRFARISSSLN